MSLSLLNEYDSSDESEDEFPAEPTASEKPSTNKNEGKNFFLGSSDSEASQSEHSDNEERTSDRDRNSDKPALPRPFDNFHAAGSDNSSVSVFRNPFLEAERAETDILERHVKLTETAYTDKLNDERDRAKHRFRKSSLPCRQFKRGRCRMGDKCRFLHAAFPTAAPGGIEAPSAIAAAIQEPTPSVYDGKAVKYTEWGKEEIVGSDDDEDGGRKKKRRVGVTNSLVPPKRALAGYEKQRRAEAAFLKD